MTSTQRPAIPFSLLLVIALISLPLLQGCVGAVVGAGAAVGVAAMEERGVDGKTRDIALETEIRAAYLDHDHRLTAAVGVEVYEGKVLLTGAIPEAAMRADAVRLAWSVEGVSDVFNEIQEVDASLLDSASDTWITTKLLSNLTFDKEVLGINYQIETVNSVVYLLGIAQNQAELDRVVAHARNVDGVRQIISHVRVKQP
ncbi:MAG: BON domain-containing protein [Magnetovibrionaceae bacterium]